MSPKMRLLTLVGLLAVIGGAAILGNRPTSPPAAQSLSSLHFAQHGAIAQAGDNATVEVLAYNPDSQAHDFTLWANFYRVPLRSLGTDHSADQVAAGHTRVHLAAGETRTIEVTTGAAKAPILSVDFQATP